MIGINGGTAYGIGRTRRRGVSNFWDSLTNVVAAYKPKGAASLADSYINLVNPSVYDAAPGVAPTWSAGNGWMLNGIDHVLNTGIVPGAAWSALIRFSHFANNKRGLLSTGGVTFILQPSNLSASARVYGHGVVAQYPASPLATSGVLALAGPNGYFNGALETSGAGASASFSQIQIGYAPISIAYFEGYIQAVVICSSTQTAGAIAAASADMAAL